MGFRMRKSFRLAKGVRVNLSKSGIGVSAGIKGARYSVHSSGRRTTSVGIPGTGLGYVSSKGGGRRSSGSRSAASQPIAMVPPRPAKPGLFAPKGEKELYKAIKSGMDIAAIDQVAQLYPSHRNQALALAAIKRLENDQEPDVAIGQLQEVFGSGYDPASDDFSQKYLSFISLSVGIPNHPVASLPFSKALLAISLSGTLLKQDRQQEALELGQYLRDSIAGQILLAELYDSCGLSDKVLESTDNLDNTDDASMLLITLRGKALAKQGYTDAALEAFKEALRFRSRPDELKKFAWRERAKAYLASGKPSQAKKDLERIMAEDSSYPELDELLEQVGGGKSAVRNAASSQQTQSGKANSLKHGKVKGDIGYHQLEEWWFSIFTDGERKYITEKYQPMSMGEETETKNHLTEGDISWTSASASNFLNGLSSWFNGPNDRAIGRKIGEKAKEEALKSKDPLDMHFALSSLITLYYRDRDQADYYDKALAYCRAQIKIQAVAAKAFLKEYPKQPMPSHVGYEQLAIVLEKEKRYQEAIDLAKEAKQNGWAGDWDKRIERCQKKLAK